MTDVISYSEHKNYTMRYKDLPRSITATYTHDYNILEVNDIIINKLKYEKENKILTLNNELNREENKIKNSQTILQRKRSICRIQEIKDRSEEHTSELQSRQYLVCRLLLEKKNKQ